jgi:hypothetical protein
MKLYTEEQVKNLLNKMDVIYSLEDLTPIELPSDEEIDKTAVEFAKKYRATTYEISAFIIGAKMVTNKIQGGNNEQR